MTTSRRRVTLYAIAWIAFITILLLVRFLAMSGAPGAERSPLAITYIVLVLVFLAISDTHERRLFLVRSGRRTSGTFGFLRAWRKPMGVELALGTLDQHSPAERELAIYNRFSTLLFFSMFPVVPLLAS